jgi:hypothetical protein
MPTNMCLPQEAENIEQEALQHVHTVVKRARIRQTTLPNTRSTLRPRDVHKPIHTFPTAATTVGPRLSHTLRPCDLHHINPFIPSLPLPLQSDPV